MNRNKTHSYRISSVLTYLVVMLALPIQAQTEVTILDKNDRRHISTELTMADYTAFAEEVTNKMLSSRLVIGWGDTRPRLVLVTPRNDTDDELILMADIEDRITEVILNSGVARLMDESAEEFEYVVRSKLSSTRQYGDGEELIFYKLEFKMFTLDGEMVGQWSDVLPLAKGMKKKGFFSRR